MSAVPRALVVTCLLLLVASAWGRRSSHRSGTSSGHSWGHSYPGWRRPNSYPTHSWSTTSINYPYPTKNFTFGNYCPPDISYTRAYKTEHPICSRLAANHATGSPFINHKNWRCGWSQGQLQNITLHWDSDTSRAASALLAAQLRHMNNFQRVRLAPNRTLLSHRPNELVISVAAVVPGVEVGANYSDGLKVYSQSHVPTRRRLHAWLTPDAQRYSVCRYTDWSAQTNLTQLSLCGFIDPHWDNSYDVAIGVVDVFGVGEDCKSTMQRLLQRAEAAGSPARATYVNRTVFNGERINSPYSFLFLDFDIWSGDFNVGVVEPPPCVPNADGVCDPELDDSTAMLVAEQDNLNENVELTKIVENFKPTPESLRIILDREANGFNIEEAACDWVDNERNFSVIDSDSKLMYPVSNRYIVLAIICVTDSHLNIAYDSIITVIKRQIYTESYDWSKHLILRRYYTVCTDTSSRLSRVFDVPNLIGVVWVGLEGAIVASRTAAERRVPLLLAAPVPDVLASGDTTWWVGGRLRHIALALEYAFNVSGYNSVAVLSEPTTYARHFLSALEDGKFDLQNFKLSRNLTQIQAKAVLRDVKATSPRAVFVNTNADTADLILAAAVELNMSHTDGVIWIVREVRKEEEKCSAKYFTISFENVELISSDKWIFGLGDDAEMEKQLPPYMVPLADALLTVSSGYKNVFERHFNVLSELHSDRAIREFDESVKEKPVTSFNGKQLIYKKRAIEEALVYVDFWCDDGTNKPMRVVEWRVNTTSGTVRNATTAAFNDDVVSAGGLNSTEDHDTGDVDSGSKSDGIKDTKITTEKPANTSNVFWVHQWIESITKIEAPANGVPVFDLLNLKNFFKPNNTNILNMTTVTH